MSKKKKIKAKSKTLVDGWRAFVITPVIGLHKQTNGVSDIKISAVGPGRVYHLESARQTLRETYSSKTTRHVSSSAHVIAVSGKAETSDSGKRRASSSPPAAALMCYLFSRQTLPANFVSLSKPCRVIYTTMTRFRLRTRSFGSLSINAAVDYTPPPPPPPPSLQVCNYRRFQRVDCRFALAYPKERGDGPSIRAVSDRKSREGRLSGTLGGTGDE